jgi:electron transfer flavoprotein alpha subunit
MKEAGFVIAINVDADSPIKDECDIFIKGRMEDVLPVLTEQLKAQNQVLEVSET